jgi:acyl carrier protein
MSNGRTHVMSDRYLQMVEAISGILADKLIVEEGQAPHLTPDTPLLSSGLNLDSVMVLELLLEIEDRFHVQFKDADLSVELFKTVGTLAGAVCQKLQDGSALA